MFERNDDVLYICYDNEAYMNTGVQRSGATPPAARTATTQAVGPEPGNVFGQGKSAPLIAMAHEIPYVATATVAELRDLEAKVRRAMEIRGARYLHVLVPCPLGWGSASKDTIRLARLAKETGMFPVFEARDGEVTRGLADPPAGARRGVPAPAEALRAPVRARAAHRGDRAHPGRRRPQHPPLRPARRDAQREVVMDKPFAITLDVGSSLANKTGAWRTERPSTSHRLPPCNHACPAGENIQQWLYHAESRRLRGGLARSSCEDNPLPGGDGARLLPPVRDRLQPRPARRGGRDQLASSASSATRRSAGLAARRADAPPTGKRVLVVGAGPSGLSAAYHLRPPRPRGDDPRGRPDAPAA